MQLFLDTIVPWRNCSLAQLFLGTTVPWHSCSLAQLFLGTTVPWHNCSLAQLLLETTVTWNNCYLKQLLLETIVTWNNCYLKQLFLVTIVPWWNLCSGVVILWCKCTLTQLFLDTLVHWHNNSLMHFFFNAVTLNATFLDTNVLDAMSRSLSLTQKFLISASRRLFDFVAVSRFCRHPRKPPLRSTERHFHSKHPDAGQPSTKDKTGRIS